MLLVGCASVGPVEVNSTDNIYTIFFSFIGFIIVWYIKSYIDFHFAKKLKRYTKELDDV